MAAVLFIVYNTVNGAIKQSGSCDEDVLFAQADGYVNHAVMEGEGTYREHYVSLGEILPRPVISAPETAPAPYMLNLEGITGDVEITDELGTTQTFPGGNTVELPAGTYEIRPPFPWKKRSIEVTA